MRKITFSIWLLWLIIFDINAQLTLESVAQRVNDLEVEVTALKVFKCKEIQLTPYIKSLFRAKMRS